MAHDIARQRLSKLRERPLHQHSRSVLEAAGQTPGADALGIPELMLWGLHQPGIREGFAEPLQLQHMVEMLLGKPTLADRTLSVALGGDEASLLAMHEPEALARELLTRLKGYLDSLHAGS